MQKTEDIIQKIKNNIEECESLIKISSFEREEDLKKLFGKKEEIGMYFKYLDTRDKNIELVRPMKAVNLIRIQKKLKNLY